MLIRRKRGWEVPERSVTPEAHYVNRRRLLAGIGIGGLILAAPAVLGRVGARPNIVSPHLPTADEGSASLYPVPRNTRYRIDRPLTPERLATTYNNFYEFGSHKGISAAAQA